MLSTKLSLAFVLALLLALSLFSSWSLRVVNGQQVRKLSVREIFSPSADSELWFNHEYALEMSHHPMFDEHLENVLADLEGFDFDVESDEVLLEYMSTLSDADAKFFRRAFRGIGRAFRGIGKGIRRVGRVFRGVGKGLAKIGKGVGKFIKKYGKIILPVALTVFSGGLGGFSLAGSLGSLGGTLAKGAALLSKVSAIASKGNAILGGLNLVTGGKSKFLNKVLNFTNKVTGILGKGSMLLGAGNSLVGGLSNFSLKNIASQLKPSELFKGSTLFEKGSNFLNKASGLIQKGQDFTGKLNELTGGKIKVLNKISNVLDKAQSFAGIGTDALKGLNGGWNSLANLKNLKNVDFKNLLTAENIQKGLSKLDNTISKTKDIVSRINDVTGGNNKSLNKILGVLDKGSMIVGAGNTAVDRFNDIKGAVSNFKNLKNTDLKNLFTVEGMQKGFSNLDNTLSKGKDLLSQVNAITGGKNKALNNLIQKIEKGQQAIGIGSTIVDQYSGIKSSIDQLASMKSNDLKKLMTFENIQTGLGKLNGALAGGEKLATQLNEFTDGRSKTLVELISKLQKGQKVTTVTSSILDGAKDAKESIEKLKTLKKEDMDKLLTAEGLQSALNRVAGAFAKGQNIASQLNEVTDGKNQGLVNLLSALQKGQTLATAGSASIDKIQGIKSAVETLKGINGKNLFTEENLQKAMDGIGAAYENGKGLVDQVKEIRNTFKKNDQPAIEAPTTETPNTEAPVDGPVDQSAAQPVDGPVDGPVDQQQGAQEGPQPIAQPDEPTAQEGEAPQPIDPATAAG